VVVAKEEGYYISFLLHKKLFEIGGRRRRRRREGE
jgi:hypothetical protein